MVEKYMKKFISFLLIFTLIFNSNHSLYAENPQSKVMAEFSTTLNSDIANDVQKSDNSVKTSHATSVEKSEVFMKKLVIFDLDGTLIDTVVDAGRCFKKTLEYFGFSTQRLKRFDCMVGGDLELIFSSLLEEKNRTAENISKLKTKYREIYAADPKPNTKPFEGILEVLQQLNANNNISIAINTNKSQILAEKLCNEMFAGINFSGIFGYIEERPSKPDPFAVNELMRINNVLPDETIFVGDSLTDIKTAQNAGVDCIFVNWVQADINQLLAENDVPFVANVPDDILKFL